MFNARLPKRSRKKATVFDLYVYRKPDMAIPRDRTGLWLPIKSQKGLPRNLVIGLWWWLPPVIWPEGEKKIKAEIDFVIKNGGRNFVLNAPWQIAFFSVKKGLNIWAGPFCNTTNVLAISSLAFMGFKGVIVSPELGQDDYFLLPKQSPLPLGIVISGNWPLCISRIISEGLKTKRTFTSPKGEKAWASKFGSDYWIYPNWILDIRSKQDKLRKAGYCQFVHLVEPLPKDIRMKKRPGLWNWELGVL